MTNKFKLDSKVVKTQLEAKTKEEVLAQMADLLEDCGYVKKSYKDGIIKREEIFPTGLPTGNIGVAIPHTDVKHVNKPMIAAATLKEPVKFRVMGGSEEEIIDVKIVFLLAMNDSTAQLELLKNIINVIQDNELLDKIALIKNEDVLLSLLEKRININ